MPPLSQSDRVRGPGRAIAWAVAAAAGVAQALSIAWPGNGQPLWWLQILSLALLAHGLRTAPCARSAAARAGVFATCWLAATFWWLFISMHTYGGLAAPLAVLAVLALSAFLGSYYALAAWIFARLKPASALGAALLFTACWTLAELARGSLWTGFPWGASGYAHVDGPLSVLPRWLGVYGTGAVAAALAYGLACLRTGQVRQWRVWALLLAGVALLAGLFWQRDCALDQCLADAKTAQPPALRVALLQGNIPQDEKFEPGSGVPLALDWYAQALRSTDAQLVVAPETALPLLPQQMPAGYLEMLEQHFRQGSQAALIGIPLGNMAEGYTNSVIGWTPAVESIYRYDKHHLVPFGEFIPPMFRWFTEMMNIPLGDFNRGGLAQTSMDWAGQRLAPNICYEDLFGEELGLRFRNPASAPTVFVNVSNIGWFGDSIAIDQHLAISRMRALEFERPMLRATNTGATVIIDHRGTVTDALAPHVRGILVGSVQGRDGLTPFARWVRWTGQAPLWLLATLVLAWAGWQQWKRRRG
ncbi:apolipoprotein N-acyltransferase [Acidovorax sp. Be4]|uniref:Apolipoprotein N-acyltransferase n=1 Tax=Acidovorax bellezanensis TaxID=2976702 RepID=A0ABT2PKN4_9BURK|nr:apolipoprotein N-acyltransferase [Acidovorax sp. Be4]MCT9810394.1 apolipoprotein N-acyltransferase [Acidovorax sp. Be4]